MQALVYFLIGLSCGFAVGTWTVVFVNRRFVKSGGHCACACDRGCC